MANVINCEVLSLGDSFELRFPFYAIAEDPTLKEKWDTAKAELIRRGYSVTEEISVAMQCMIAVCRLVSFPCQLASASVSMLNA